MTVTEASAARPNARTRTPRGTSIGIGLIWVIATFAMLFDALGLFSMTTGLFFVNALQGDVETHQSLTALPQFIQAELREGAPPADLTDLSIWVRLLCALPTFMHLLVLLVSTILVTRAIRVIEAGRPFTRTGVRAWALLGIVLIIGGGIQGVLDTVAVGVASSLARTNPDGHPDGPWALGGDYQALGTNFPDWPWIFFVLGIIAAAVAAAFREGSRLEAEVEGVV
ncbi:hypothetical protein ASE14_15860 [Agromyces sp. Root81]|uniref:hypothetical protein n=1 Tax=Agromyces sp. Root81 TaxID=1736601 RepID=UPI0006FA99F2|nr:hypothetical protein [Agromyces sp. Root81]KRC59238.1 hypothetical protein ASE14_15860 [Agromyces sp. Root81]